MLKPHCMFIWTTRMMKYVANDIFIISSSFISPEKINELANNSSCNIILYPEFSGCDESGHWKLNVYLKNENIIYLIDSLKPTYSRTCMFTKAFPEATNAYLIRGIVRQHGLTCGYWCIFYIFIICATKSVNGIGKIVTELNYLFNVFIKYVIDYTNEIFLLANNKMETDK